MANPLYHYRLLGVNEVAKILGLHPATIRRLAREGKLPPSATIGRRARRWRYCDIVAWAEAHYPE